VSPLAAFPLFPWAGFLFAGVIVGDLVDAARESPRRERWLQAGLATFAGAGVWLAWQASFQPALFPTARFWHDSPTFFFIRLGVNALCIPVVWAMARMMPHVVLEPLAVVGRASLFVYWIHIEMVYGVIAEPMKRQLPLWQSLLATAVLILGLYALVHLKNRLVERHGLSGPYRLLAPLLR
jgi:acyltransferase